MTIDGSQNVGVGVTPSAWLSTARALDIGTRGSLVDWSSSQQTDIWSNGYFNGTNSIYKTTANASIYRQSVGQHIWYNADSGTAGNAITFPQAMTLDASGNWLLGAPTYSAGNGNYLLASPTGVLWVGHINGTSSGTAYENFQYNGSSIGSITQNGTKGVLYNLTSDYRLKNNQEDLKGAKDFIMALKPK